jgi:hypothetical protein
MMKFNALAAAAAAFTLIASGAASAQYHTQHTGTGYEPYKQQYHHKPSYQYHHQPSYQKHYYKPTYQYQQPTYYNPHYAPKKVEEVCFKWTKDGYGHATKVIIPCPHQQVVVKKPVIEKEQKPVEQQPTEQQPTEQQPTEQQQ